MTKLLIDADGLVLTAVQSAMQTIVWEDLHESVFVDLEMAKQNVYSMIEKYQTETGIVADPIMALSDPTRRYFRHEVYPEYKGNRHGQGLKVGMGTIRTWLTDTFTAYEIPGLEGDDVLGILATQYMEDHPKDDLPVIVSVDKDLQQIPCRHLNAAYPSHGITEVTPEEGQRYWWYQVLTGDTVDGYPGCKGIGPVRAERILAEAESYPEAVAAAYEKAGHPPEYMESMANVARILTVYCWDEVKQKPILWSRSDG